MADGHIVHEETQPVNVESVSDGEVIFELGKDNNYRLFTIDEAVFKVLKVKFSNGYYYKATSEGKVK